MKLQLDTTVFKHVPEKSSYNHNYYRDDRFEILEICHEDCNFYEFKLVINNREDDFIGCSEYSFSDGGILIIDYLEYYT